MVFSVSSVALALLSLVTIGYAQSSCTQIRPSGSIRPSLASGYQMQVVATGLSSPRGILLDRSGKLLVVEQGRGRISVHTLRESNGCVSVASSKNLTDNLSLNHGIELSADGRTLYASSSDKAFAWDYNESAATVANNRTLVNNMLGSDHSTRTLLLSRRANGMMVIARGSTSNIDIAAADITSGSSQVKAFNISNATTPYNFKTQGVLLGWGLRNEVGLAEHQGSNGGVYGVENSADQQTRMGVDIHQDNPAEELNYLGDLSRRTGLGKNFGYPYCFSTWDRNALPDNGNLSVGSQYAIDATAASNNTNRTDAYCAQQQQASLVFQAHMAPLDIKFNNSGREAWITFHGSWNRDAPVGYKMSVVAFNQDGTPVDRPTSMTAATDIFANVDLSRCPGNCFRPVAMAIDSQGRIYMSSDSSGEIYLITRTASATTSSSATATSRSAAGSVMVASWNIGLLGILGIVVSVAFGIGTLV